MNKNPNLERAETHADFMILLLAEINPNAK